MRPKAQHLDRLRFGVYRIDEAMLDIDAAGIVTGEITDQLFIRRGIPERILCQHGQQCFRPLFKADTGNQRAVLHGLLCKDDLIHHQASSGS
nr:MAG TPA: hypothetical protein [Caudoviricetes sp.]